MEWLANFGMREWLISCGIVLVLVVLLDGYRRMRAERRGEIKMALRMGGEFPDIPEDEDFSSELPNGGARVINREEPGFESIGAAVGEASEDDLFETDYDPAALDAEIPEPAAASGGAQITPDQQILVMHARSRDDDGFNGSDLLQVLLACDLRYGDRDILHRHERAGGRGELQFSVANMVEPGTFNLEDISSFRTPGVTFFMTLPGAEEPEQAFDCMLETANCVVRNLEAELLDDSHRPMTDQLLAQYREQVQRYNGVHA